MLPIKLVAYLVLFIVVGVLFLFVSLLIGRFIRPSAHSVVKGEPYECGEPAVGSSFIQFDLRFYVVALLFIVFEVELAFFFPPAVVFGKVNQLRGSNFGPIVERSAADSELHLTPAAKEKFGELGVPPMSVERGENESKTLQASSVNNQPSLQDDLKSLSLMAMLDLGVFFVVLLVGFAYLWKQGDLNWVRAYSQSPVKESGNPALLRQSGGGA
jgi:NADH-quinone oxidoreductase subunit A